MERPRNAEWGVFLSFADGSTCHDKEDHPLEVTCNGNEHPRCRRRHFVTTPSPHLIEDSVLASWHHQLIEGVAGDTALLGRESEDHFDGTFCGTSHHMSRLIRKPQHNAQSYSDESGCTKWTIGFLGKTVTVTVKNSGDGGAPSYLCGN